MNDARMAAVQEPVNLYTVAAMTMPAAAASQYDRNAPR